MKKLFFISLLPLAAINVYCQCADGQYSINTVNDAFDNAPLIVLCKVITLNGSTSGNGSSNAAVVEITKTLKGDQVATTQIGHEVKEGLVLQSSSDEYSVKLDQYYLLFIYGNGEMSMCSPNAKLTPKELKTYKRMSIRKMKKQLINKGNSR